VGGTVGDVRIATWNVNSLKARLPRVEEWLAQVQPDVVCMQETKLSDSAFPALTFAGLGYESAHHGQGQWNGVAILSKVGLIDVVSNFATASGRPTPTPASSPRLRGHPLRQRVRAERARVGTSTTSTSSRGWRSCAVTSSASRSRDEPLVCSATSTSRPTTATCTTRASSTARRTSARPERALLDELKAWGLATSSAPVRRAEAVQLVGLPRR
jgi:exodeoxyribonuclease-3